VHIITDQSVIIAFNILFVWVFVRSVLASVWLAFNISSTSTGKTFLNITGSRLIGFHRFGPCLNALCQFEASLCNFILIQNINLVWVLVFISVEDDVAFVIVRFQLIFALDLFDICLNVRLWRFFSKKLTLLNIRKIIHKSFKIKSHVSNFPTTDFKKAEAAFMV
jgi:hypothetical protein